MNAIAKRWTGSPASSADRRQLMLLAGLSAVLVLLLVWQAPKLLGGSKSSSEASPAVSSLVTPAAAPVTAAMAPPASSPAARRAARWIKRQPARDPFVPLAGAPEATPVATPAPAPEPKAPPAAPPAAPTVAPTAAVIWTNGHRQVIGVKQQFKLGDTTFRLASVTRGNVKIAPVLGSLAGGRGELTLSRTKPLTIENSVTGVQYRINFTLAMSAVPPAGR